jgi:hypothetical protein
MKLLFDRGPKDKREELFGRDEEISEMMRLIASLWKATRSSPETISKRKI